MLYKKVNRYVTSILHSFDKFGEPISPINFKGETTYKTRLGGVCALTIYTLLGWFIVLKLV
jgi:hypothetical protein